MFVEKLDLNSDLINCQTSFDEVLKITSWHHHQIGLRHRPNAENIWHDCLGSLYDRDTKIYRATESDFSMWCLDEKNYLRQQIENLAQQYKFTLGRVRFMRLLPKQGLSVHSDNENRYHLVLKTNDFSYICNNVNSYNKTLQEIAKCYHIPFDGFWYKVKTTETHWVYNGGKTERIHVVVCET